MAQEVGEDERAESLRAASFTIPYFIGSLFCHIIHVWLERYPKRASIIRLAGEGNWFNQFRVVTLIRISSFPYMVYNYCAMATDVKYGPYLLGTMVGMVHEIFVALYIGILITTLAHASHDRHSMSALEIIYNVIGFCTTVVTTVIITLFGLWVINMEVFFGSMRLMIYVNVGRSAFSRSSSFLYVLFYCDCDGPIRFYFQTLLVMDRVILKLSSDISYLVVIIVIFNLISEYCHFESLGIRIVYICVYI